MIITRLALAICFVSVVTTASIAQNSNPLPNLNVTTDYDRFKDVTSITMLGASVDNLTGGATKMQFSALGTFPGKKLTGPASIILVLSSVSTEWLFLGGSHTLRAILNGEERLTLGEMKRASSTVKTGYVIEQLVLTVTSKDLAKLANAKKVEMQVDGVEFELPSAIISDLKDFIRLTSP